MPNSDLRTRRIVTFAVETGLRTNEFLALERRDIDRSGEVPVVIVRRRVGANLPKNERIRRAPLTDRAVEALDSVPARLDSRLLFAACRGGCINLNNWRRRVWDPALDSAGVRQRGPYALRHTFASEALAVGVSVFELSRIMGNSVEMIDQHYGHLVSDSERTITDRLNARSCVVLESESEDDPESLALTGQRP